MPWTSADAKGKTKAADTPKKQKAWAKIANRVLLDCRKGGESKEECEGRAIRIANSQIAKMGEVGTTKGYSAITVKVGKQRVPIGELIDFWQEAQNNEDETSVVKPAATNEPAEEQDVYFDPQGIRRELPYGNVISFADLHSAHDAVRASWRVEELTEQYKRLIENVIYSSEVEDKPAAIRSLSEEFIILMEEKVKTTSEALVLEGVEFLGEAESVALAESAAGSAVKILEAGDVDEGGDRPLIMQVALIEPGWNSAEEGTPESRYYPREVLERDIGVFALNQMHETDHEDRSNETWKSTVMEVPVGFTETGGPLAKVGIHDPGFATRAKNLEELGLLDQLQCSILGLGDVIKGRAEGREGKIVEALTKGHFVDWVTRAGAGGRAVGLGESGGGNMIDEAKVKTLLAESELSEEARKRLLKGKYETEGEVKEAILKEAAPSKLDKAKAKEIIKAAELPELAKERLAETEYADEDALKEQIKAEARYVKEIVGAGKPVGNDGKTPGRKTPEETLEEIDKAKSAVNKKWAEGGM